MFVAKKSNGEKINISDAKIGVDYFCPVCDSKLIIKMGKIRIPHFAHKSDCRCNDNWHYDMTDWHYDWQNQFPIENQEVVLSKNGQKHRADILINNTVIEFQHSELSLEEFNDRNNFYNSLNYHVEWIFNAIDDGVEYISNTKNGHGEIFCWHYPKKI